MVGIVVVSHSSTLAAGVKELVAQMVPEMGRIAYVGGTGDPENPIGTDPMQVLQAIGDVAGEDGVLVLMDLGSALLSAEAALDFLDQEQRERVRLSSAPLVEGTLSAAIQAHMGSDLTTVAREAENALGMKISQLGGGQAEPPELEPASPNALELPLVIDNRNGLHARPAARLVSCAGSFSGRITIEKNGTRASARSINEVMTLGIRKGDRIVVRFEGEDAAAALRAVEKLHADHFGEREPSGAAPGGLETRPRAPRQEGMLTGVPAAPGIAIGPVLKFEAVISEVESKTVGDTKAEVARLRDALSAAVAASTALQNKAQKSADREQAEILEFHKLLLQDEETVDTAVSIISKQSLCAEYAWKTATDAVAKRYESIADDYLRTRVADVYDIQRSVLRQLSPTSEPTFAGDKPVILVAPDLSPSEAAGLPREKILGICLAAGGATSHAAIIAASRGFPTVVGVTGIFAAVKNDQVIVLDGGQGRILTEPDGATLERFKAEQDAWQAARQRQMRLSREPATTADGVRIEIAANIAGPADLPAALENGAEGVGLFRTEFLFLDRTAPPGEEEQLEVYQTVARQMPGRPVIIRTLDIGGDKQVPYLAADHEENPFLGVRGIRLALANRELFLCQLRAILRAGEDGDIRILFPMIGSVQDFRDALLALEEAKSQLRSRGIAFAENLPAGVMIEVPSAVVVADQLAEVAGFFSIGTNDLAQYVMAADRGNPGVAALPDPFHPAVLRMIKQTVDAARQGGIPVGMCGAFAGLPEAAGLLVGLGLEELSMNAPAIPAQKAAIRGFSAQKARELAARALALTSADEVRDLAKSNWQTGSS